MTETDYILRAEGIKNAMYRTAYAYLGGEAPALDAVDEAVYRGFKGYKKLRQPEFFTTWLTRILMNVCNAELRRTKREVSVAVLPETGLEDFDALPLKDALARLPKDLRSVIILRYFTGLTLAETAAALDIPQGTASTRQRRALTLLRLELTDGEEERI